MTSCSVLPSGYKASVIATWTSEFSDHSAKISILAGAEPAAELAYLLTGRARPAGDRGPAAAG